MADPLSLAISRAQAEAAEAEHAVVLAKQRATLSSTPQVRQSSAKLDRWPSSALAEIEVDGSAVSALSKLGGWTPWKPRPNFSAMTSPDSPLVARANSLYNQALVDAAEAKSAEELATLTQKARQTLAELAARGVVDERLLTSTSAEIDSISLHLSLARKRLLSFCCAPFATTPRGTTEAAAEEEEVVPSYALRGLNADQVQRDGLIVPVAEWKEKWDLFVLLLILYSAVVVPIRVCFSEDATGAVWLFEVMVTLCFLLDMYFTFHTVVYEATRERWISTKSGIAKNYLSGWFWIDAPASVPVELIDIILEDTGSLGLLRFLRMFRLLRLLKLLKVEEYIDALENKLDMNLRILRVVFMLVKISFLAHLLGCFWYYTAVLQRGDVPEEDAEGEEPPPTWISSYNAGRLVEPDATLGERYLYSVYWAITLLSTVGYGDIIPTNNAERLYCLLSMLISALVFGYMIGSIGTLIQYLDRQSVLVEEKTDAVKEYVEWRKLPRELSHRVKGYYNFFFTRRTAFDEVELLGGLSPSLRADVTKFVLRQTLGRVPLFSSQLDPEFQMQVLQYIKPASHARHETIFHRGDVSRELVFLLKGEVSVHSPIDGRMTSIIKPTEEVILAPAEGNRNTYDDNEENYVEVTTVQTTGCFGESVLTGRRRHATHKAHRWCETLVLTGEDLAILFDGNPRTGRRVVTRLLEADASKERLRLLMARFLIGTLKPGDALRAALIIQTAWSVSLQRNTYTGSLASLYLEATSNPSSRKASDVVADAKKQCKGGLESKSDPAKQPSAEAVHAELNRRMTRLFEGLHHEAAGVAQRL